MNDGAGRGADPDATVALLTRIAALESELQDVNDEATQFLTKAADLETKLSQANTTISFLNNSNRQQSVGNHSLNSLTGGRSAKVDDPPVFYADPSKDTIPFEYWYDTMEGKLRANADHYASGEDEMTAIKGKLEGTAAANLLTYIQSTNPNRIRTKDALMKHLWIEYYDHNAVALAEDAFADLKMDPKQDFLAFKNEFVRLAGESGEPRDKWKHLLKKKITDRRQNALVTHWFAPNMDFDKICQMARQVDLTFKLQAKSKNEKRGDAKSTGSSSNTNAGGRNGGGSNRNNSIVNNSNGGNRLKPHEKNWAKGKLSEREIVQFTVEGRCFNCRETGHRARDCPTTVPYQDNTQKKDNEVRLAEIAARYGYDPKVLFRDKEGQNNTEPEN